MPELHATVAAIGTPHTMPLTSMHACAPCSPGFAPARHCIERCHACLSQHSCIDRFCVVSVAEVGGLWSCHSTPATPSHTTCGTAILRPANTHPHTHVGGPLANTKMVLVLSRHCMASTQCHRERSSSRHGRRCNSAGSTYHWGHRQARGHGTHAPNTGAAGGHGTTADAHPHRCANSAAATRPAAAADDVPAPTHRAAVTCPPRERAPRHRVGVRCRCALGDGGRKRCVPAGCQPDVHASTAIIIAGLHGPGRALRRRQQVRVCVARARSRSLSLSLCVRVHVQCCRGCTWPMSAARTGRGMACGFHAFEQPDCCSTALASHVVGAVLPWLALYGVVYTDPVSLAHTAPPAPSVLSAPHWPVSFALRVLASA